MKYLSLVSLTLLASLLVFPGSPVSAQPDNKTIFLSGTLSIKNSYAGRWLEMIYTEAFHRLGYRLNYRGFPAKRASLMSDSGKSDGEIHRVATYGRKHPMLIRVEEPHFNDHFVALTIRDDLTLDGWDSLKGRQLKVGHRRGVMKTTNKLAGLVPAKRSFVTSKMLNGLKMLSGRRTDIYIDAGLATKDILRNNASLNNIRVAGIMEEVPTHAFLHSRHQKLALELAETLRAMKREGVIKKFAELLK